MQTKNLYLGKDPFSSPLSISRLVHLVGEWVSESIEGCVGGWGPNDWTNPFGNRGDLNVSPEPQLRRRPDYRSGERPAAACTNHAALQLYQLRRLQFLVWTVSIICLILIPVILDIRHPQKHVSLVPDCHVELSVKQFWKDPWGSEVRQLRRDPSKGSELGYFGSNPSKGSRNSNGGPDCSLFIHGLAKSLSLKGVRFKFKQTL